MLCLARLWGLGLSGNRKEGIKKEQIDTQRETWGQGTGHSDRETIVPKNLTLFIYVELNRETGLLYTVEDECGLVVDS